MARTQFDRDHVIRQSTQLFWQHGYSGSSMQQVFKATGLKPGSVYLAFGSKEGLYREALDAYAEETLAHITRVIEKAPSVGEGICQILEAMVADTQAKAYCSCFLIKSQLELAAERHELQAYASDQLKRIEQVYAQYLQLDDVDVAQLRACSIMLHIFGVRVYGYMEPQQQNLLAGLQAGLPWLPWDKRSA